MCDFSILVYSLHQYLSDGDPDRCICVRSAHPTRVPMFMLGNPETFKMSNCFPKQACPKYRFLYLVAISRRWGDGISSLTFEASISYCHMKDPKCFILEMIWKAEIRKKILEQIKLLLPHYAIWSGVINSREIMPSSRTRFYIVGVNVLKVREFLRGSPLLQLDMRLYYFIPAPPHIAFSFVWIQSQPVDGSSRFKNSQPHFNTSANTYTHNHAYNLYMCHSYMLVMSCTTKCNIYMYIYTIIHIYIYIYIYK